MNARYEQVFRGRSLLFCLAALVGAAAPAAAGEEWPCWRGPARDGVVTGFQPPAAWPAELKKLWSAEVGEGHSSPVAAGARIYQFSRQADEEVVTCFDLSGHKVWQQRYAAPYEMSPDARAHGKGPKSTPAVAGGRLFTLGISGILTAWSADTGQRLWQREFGQQFPKTSPLYGTAMSPLASGRYCFAHVGGHGRGAFTMFDAGTGKTIAAWDQDGPAYASPVVARWEETPQLVTQTQNLCVGLSGDAKLLWSVPFKTAYDQNSVTPLVYQDLAIVSGYNLGLSAYRITKSGGGFQAQEAWRNDGVSLYMNSPVRVGDRLFCFSQRKSGQICCVAAGSGKTLWEGPGRQGDNAALLAAGQTLIALTTRGELQFLDAAASEHRLLAKYRVAESPTWAHPLVLGARVLVKDANHLSLWSWE